MPGAAFDAGAFLKTRPVPRTQDCRVPALADFFPEGEDPIWTVRGLTGAEWAVAIEAEQRVKAKFALAGAISDSKEAVEVIRAAAGIPEPDSVASYVQSVEFLVLGSVAPKCTYELANKLATAHPFVFYELVKVIKLLTGIGADLGKQKPSGATPESAQP